MTWMSLDEPALGIPSCALDRAGVDAQRARYRRLAETVGTVERTGQTVVVRFGPSLDRDLLRETLDVERACCPFFTFDVADAHRTVTIGVNHPDQVPALDVLAAALAPDQ
jgi:hypothetical protein